VATREGIHLNSPVRTRSGAAPVEPLVRVEGAGVLVSSVKLAHDRSGDLVVRVYEPQGRRAAAVLHVDPAFGAGREVSLIEDELADAPALSAPGDGVATAGAGVALSLTPFSVRTFRFSRV